MKKFNSFMMTTKRNSRLEIEMQKIYTRQWTTS